MFYLCTTTHQAKKLTKRSAALCLTLVTVCVVSTSATTTAIAAAVMSVDKTRDQAERLLRNGEFVQAEKLFRERLTKNAKDNRARLGLSFALLKQQSLQDAFDQAARVVTDDRGSARGFALLGQALLAVGDFKSAIDAFRASLTLQGDEALAVAGIAMVDFYENRLAQSLAGLRRAVSLAPNDPDYIFSLAQAAARYERYREAADAYERFLSVTPRTDEDRRARIRGLIDFLRYLGQQSTLYRESGASNLPVPFELINNRPVMRVYVNGSREPLRFVLDTGSGMCVISHETAKRLGLKPVARGGNARAVGGGGSFEILYGFLQSVQMGGARVESVPVYIRQFYNTQEAIDGYLGLAVMSKFLTSIDYGERTVKFQSRRHEATPPVINHASNSAAASSSTTADASAVNTTVVPIRTTSSGFWSGEVRVDGVSKPLNFIVDTGASISVVSEELATREEMGRYAQATKLKVYGAAGVAENVQMLLLPKVNLGAFMRPSVPAVVLNLKSINETAGFEQTGIIGGNVLRHYRVIFDFRNTVVRLEPLSQSIKQSQVKPVGKPLGNAPQGAMSNP